MSMKSDELRRKAFEHLKLAKLSQSLDERRGHRTIARSYEALAETESWLEGAARRRAAATGKPPYSPSGSHGA
ncbi:MAG: hypothetical protein ACTHLY_20625 [Pseudolabrys sp.]